MYYEREGMGDPLLYIPPFLGVAGVNAVPALARTHSVITGDLQGHGRTAALPERPMSLQQNARDVIALLRQLGISKVDLLGESYGGGWHKLAHGRAICAVFCGLATCSLR
jgi:pimeloyl-ACP methyl ester carboxylesterase